MMRKGSIEAQWFIIFGIVLVAITTLILFMRITSIMGEDDFFYEYHGDQMIMILEALSTTSERKAIVYDIGTLNIRSLWLETKEDDGNAILHYSPTRSKIVLLPISDNSDAKVEDATGKLLFYYGSEGFNIVNINECTDNSDIIGLNILIHNPKNIAYRDARALYIAAKDQETRCRIRNYITEEYVVLARAGRIYSTIQPFLREAYDEEYDAIITVHADE